MMRVILTSCLVLALVIAAPVKALASSGAEPAIQVWLDRMAKALREESYEGVFTYMRGYRFDTVRVVHEFVDGKEVERLVHLNGEPREVFREGDSIVCRHEKDGDVDPQLEHEVPLGPFTHTFNENLANYQSMYDFELQGKDRIAGRSAIRLGVTPHNEDRYGYRLWLDEATGLLLQSHLMNRGRVLEVFQFSEVSIGTPIDSSRFASTLTGEVVEHNLVPLDSERAEASSRPKWQLTWLPSGFRPVRSRGPNRILFSDGIATFSVFVDEADSSTVGEVVTHQGGTVVVSLRLKNSSQQITVVGEVPVDTARRIAESVEPVAGQD